jgi:DNA-binding NarL/FixJ family response regulator
LFALNTRRFRHKTKPDEGVTEAARQSALPTRWIGVLWLVHSCYLTHASLPSEIKKPCSATRGRISDYEAPVATARNAMPHAIKKITVLLAEDHQIVREGVHALLKHEPDLEVIGEAENGRQAVESVRKLRPDVVVMDIAMPLLNGLEATRQILKSIPATRVLILSAHSEDAYVEQVVALGASGFLLKHTSGHVLAQAIREVEKGNRVFSPALSRRVTERSQKLKTQPTSKTNLLSSREREVLQLIAEGKANKQVAAELGVSFKTVDKHRQHLMSKLDIHDVACLTRYAITEGIIENTIREPVL